MPTPGEHYRVRDEILSMAEESVRDAAVQWEDLGRAVNEVHLDMQTAIDRLMAPDGGWSGQGATAFTDVAQTTLDQSRKLAGDAYFGAQGDGSDSSVQLDNPDANMSTVLLGVADDIQVAFEPNNTPLTPWHQEPTWNWHKDGTSAGEVVDGVARIASPAYGVVRGLTDSPDKDYKVKDTSGATLASYTEDEAIQIAAAAGAASHEPGDGMTGEDVDKILEYLGYNQSEYDANVQTEQNLAETFANAQLPAIASGNVDAWGDVQPDVGAVPPGGLGAGGGVPGGTGSGAGGSAPTASGYSPDGTSPAGYDPPDGTLPTGYDPPDGTTPDGYNPPGGTTPTGYDPSGYNPPGGTSPAAYDPAGYDPSGGIGTGADFGDPGDDLWDPSEWDGSGTTAAGYNGGGLGAGSASGVGGTPGSGGIGATAGPGSTGGPSGASLVGGPAGTGTGPGVAGAAGTGAGRGGIAPMMPLGGAGQGENGNERTTWLEEDEDVWGTNQDAPPPVIT